MNEKFGYAKAFGLGNGTVLVLMANRGLPLAISEQYEIDRSLFNDVRKPEEVGIGITIPFGRRGRNLSKNNYEKVQKFLTKV